MGAESSLQSSLASVLEEIRAADSSLSSKRIEKACMFAQQIYGQQRHWIDVPLVQHAVDVLRELLAFHPDEDAIIACLLHHALETRRITLPELEDEFGKSVRELVSGVHLLSQVQVQRTRNSIDDLRLMLLSVSDDIRVILIILCDRLTLLTQLDHMEEADRRWTCQNILQLFAPVAARLGIQKLKQRLEGLAFPVLYPTDAARIHEQLDDIHKRYGEFLPDASAKLESTLREQGIEARVDGREKASYSIFVKMTQKSYTHVEQLHDLFALRVITRSEEECYRALGAIHRLGPPAPGRFKDYIAFPKPNGYRSLHTTMVRLPGVPEGLFIEIQVRTEQMNREAEYGIAAHWSYKEKGSAQRAVERVQLQEVLARQQAIAPELLRGSSLVDHIYVLTPTGDIVELPEGATPLDFAFQIHTQVGLSFKAASVNGTIVPLTHELENGDVVEIIRHRTPQPSSEWLGLVKMASSRARLKRYLYSLRRSDFISQGRDLLNEELRKLHVPPLDSDYSLLRKYDGKTLTMSEREDILMKVGQGSERAATLLQHLDVLKIQASPEVRERVTKAVERPVAVHVEAEEGLKLPVQFAKCCKPDAAEGDPIIGVVGRSGRVVIHKRACRMVKSANRDRRINVRWVQSPSPRRADRKPKRHGRGTSARGGR